MDTECLGASVAHMEEAVWASARRAMAEARVGKSVGVVQAEPAEGQRAKVGWAAVTAATGVLPHRTVRTRG